MTTIITKNSSTAGAVPTSSDLVQGELAVNVTDKALYTEDASGTVVKLNTPSIVDNGNATAITINSSENVGVGTSSPSQKLSVAGNVSTTGYLSTGSTNILFINPNYDTNLMAVQGYSNVPLAFCTNNTERMRIDSSGNLLVGTTSASLSSGTGIKLLPGYSAQFGIVTNESSNNSHYHHYNTNATYNGYRFYTLTNGGIANYSGNNQNLSDERSKKNIEVSGGYLDKICAIPVKLFNYKDEQDGEQRTLGVIAQDVEVVAPELVNFDGFGDTPEDGVPLKSIYTTDIMFALMKCIQEQQAIIEQLQADVAALKGQA